MAITGAEGEAKGEKCFKKRNPIIYTSRNMGVEKNLKSWIPVFGKSPLFESRGPGRVETKSKFSFLEECQVANVLYGGLGQGWTITEGGHIDKGPKLDWGSWGKGGGGGRCHLSKGSSSHFRCRVQKQWLWLGIRDVSLWGVGTNAHRSSWVSVSRRYLLASSHAREVESWGLRHQAKIWKNRWGGRK